MPRTCTVCTHPLRHDVDLALIGGEQSIRDIASQTGFSRAALQRHRAHIPRELVQAQEAQDVAEASKVLQAVHELQARLGRALDQAEESKNLRDLARLARELRETLRLLGELSGELQRGAAVQVSTTVQVAPTQLELVAMARIAKAEAEQVLGAHGTPLAALEGPGP